MLFRSTGSKRGGERKDEKEEQLQGGGKGSGKAKGQRQLTTPRLSERVEIGGSRAQAFMVREIASPERIQASRKEQARAEQARPRTAKDYVDMLRTASDSARP